jgi:hypothetical protein
LAIVFISKWDDVSEKREKKQIQAHNIANNMPKSGAKSRSIFKNRVFAVDSSKKQIEEQIAASQPPPAFVIDRANMYHA